MMIGTESEALVLCVLCPRHGAWGIAAKAKVQAAVTAGEVRWPGKARR